MPDKVRSVTELAHDIEDILKEQDGNTCKTKHRQHVTQAITQVVNNLITSGKMRECYINDCIGSKPSVKTPPALLSLSAALQEMASEVYGRKMLYAVVPISSRDAKHVVEQKQDKSMTDSVIKSKEVPQKKKDNHARAIVDWQTVYKERQKVIDAGFGDEYNKLETNIKQIAAEQNITDVTSDEYDRKSEEIKKKKKKLKELKNKFDTKINYYDDLLFKHHEKIVLPDIHEYNYVPNWEGYKLPTKEWCNWIDNLEDHMKIKYPDKAAHTDEEATWFKKMHKKKDAIDTFYANTVRIGEKYQIDDAILAKSPLPRPYKESDGQKSNVGDVSSLTSLECQTEVSDSLPTHSADKRMDIIVKWFEEQGKPPPQKDGQKDGELFFDKYGFDGGNFWKNCSRSVGAQHKELFAKGLEKSPKMKKWYENLIEVRTKKGAELRIDDRAAAAEVTKIVTTVVNEEPVAKKARLIVKFGKKS